MFFKNVFQYLPYVFIASAKIGYDILLQQEAAIFSGLFTRICSEWCKFILLPLLSTVTLVSSANRMQTSVYGSYVPVASRQPFLIITLISNFYCLIFHGILFGFSQLTLFSKEYIQRVLIHARPNYPEKSGQI